MRSLLFAAPLTVYTIQVVVVVYWRLYAVQTDPSWWCRHLESVLTKLSDYLSPAGKPVLSQPLPTHHLPLPALTRDVDSDMPPHTMAYHPPPPLLPRPEMSPLHPLHHPPPSLPPFQHHQHFPPHFPALGPTNSFSTHSGGEYENISKS